MDHLIQSLSEQNHNPALREDLVHDLWNGETGKSYDSPEALDRALSGDNDPALVAAARNWLGLPIFE